MQYSDHSNLHHFLHVIHSLINYIRIFKNHKETEGAFRNAFYTSVALTVSTFIYGRTPTNLSLVDGLIVTFLPLSITTGAVYNAVNISKGKVALQVACMMHFFATTAFGLTVWTHVDTYGTSPGCNLNSSVKVVVFGHSVAATNRGLRNFAIFTFVLSAIFTPVFSAVFTFVFSAIFTPVNALSTATYQSYRDADSNSPFRLVCVRVIANINWAMTMVMYATWVYGVVTVEEIIRRNGFSHSTSQWTCGQTFAVVLMLGPVTNLGSVLVRRMGWRRSGQISPFLQKLLSPLKLPISAPTHQAVQNLAEG